MVLEEDINKKLGQIALKVQRQIKQETPVSTGRLRNSIVVNKVGNEWVVGTNLEYAEYVELGVKPHTIKPLNKKALSFIWNGQRVFFKSVEHPGFDGRNMFLNGSILAKNLIQEEFSK